MFSRSFLLCLLLCAAATAHAQRYRWVDEQGRAHYSDTPPASAKAVRKSNLKTDTPAEEPQQVPFDVLQAQKDFPVTLYTAPICKQLCEQARTALNKRGVPFTEVQVWNTETLDQLKTKAGSDNVPALVVGRSALSGFDPARFDSLLDSAGYPKQGAAPERAQRAPATPEGYEPPPQAEPVKPETATGKPGPYDTSKLPSNRVDKPGLYDASGLKANRPEKRGQYVTPDGAK